MEYLTHWSVMGPSFIVSGVLLLIYLNQRKLVYANYFPQDCRTNVPKPSEMGMNNYEDLKIPSKDGTLIHAYFIRTPFPSPSQPTVFYFHPNAGNMGYSLPILRPICLEMGANIFMISYRGYGYSEGDPHEKGIKEDAEASFEYLTQKLNVNPSKVVLYGQSIGGAVALHLAAKYGDKIGGVMVENTFLSVPKLVPFLMPYLKYFTILATEKWENEKIIGNVVAPILFLSGRKDQMIPPFMMDTLFSLSGSSKMKLMKHYPEGTHNDTCMQHRYFNDIYEFLTLIGFGRQ